MQVEWEVSCRVGGCFGCCGTWCGAGFVGLAGAIHFDRARDLKDVGRRGYSLARAIGVAPPVLRVEDGRLRFTGMPAGPSRCCGPLRDELTPLPHDASSPRARLSRRTVPTASNVS